VTLKVQDAPQADARFSHLAQPSLGLRTGRRHSSCEENQSMSRSSFQARLRASSWLLAALILSGGGASGAFAQVQSCQVTYTAPTWVGGNGFGASIDIRNTGPSVTGWTLVFSFPNGQRLQNGWPVSTSSSRFPWSAIL